MNLLDLHDEILLEVQSYLGWRSLIAFSSLSRRLRCLASPLLWEDLRLELFDDDEEERLEEIQGMRWIAKGSASDFGFNLKYVKKDLFFSWGIFKKPHFSPEAEETEEDGLGGQYLEFFRLLIDIISRAGSIQSVVFEGFLSDDVHSRFVMGLFSGLWAPIAALPKLRHLYLPTFPRAATWIDTNAGWGQDLPSSSTLTHLHYGDGALSDTSEHDLRLRHLPNLESLRIGSIRSGSKVGFLSWCTDEFCKSVRLLEFDGDMPADWEDLLLNLRDYASRGNSSPRLRRKLLRTSIAALWRAFFAKSTRFQTHHRRFREQRTEGASSPFPG